MDAVSQDARYAVRLLAKSPGFTAAAVLSLALGIGANTTIFTWIDAVLIDPIGGVDRPEQLVAVSSTDPRGDFSSFSYADYLDYRRSPALAGLLAQDELAMSLGVDGQNERVWGLIVSENYFDVLGVRPALGRGFLAEEGRGEGGAPVVVISHALWQRRFAGDPRVIGRRVSLNTHPFTIVGVTQPDFRGSVVGLVLDAWVPLTMQPQLLAGSRLPQRGNRWLQCLGRLRPDLGLEQARAELSLTARRLAQTHPEDRNLGVAVHRLWNSPNGGARVMGPALLVLGAVTALVLLIACANVANLLLARATSRRREVAVRLSLGASRARLLRQLLTESLLLGLIGGGAGMLIAHWGSDLLQLLFPPTDLPVAVEPHVDLRALGFTLAASLLTGALFGLAPALRATRGELTPALRETSPAGGRRSGRLRGSLVVGQVALSLLLLVAAGLLLRSLQHARSFDPGFNPRGVLLASVDLFANGYTRDTGIVFHQEALARLSALPGVRSVSLTRRPPLGLGGSSSSTLDVEGHVAPESERAWAYTHAVGPAYFRTLEQPLLRGRDFGAGDVRDAAPVVIVGEAMARRYWGERDALGGRVDLWGIRFTVVGIARDAKFRQLGEPPAPHVYVPVLQNYQPQMTLLVRTEGDPLALAPAVTAQLRGLDPRLPVFNVLPFEEFVRAASFQQRLLGSLLTGFGTLALLLAGVGLYGVLAYAVAQRTREIGIRIALGGRPADIFGLVTRQGLGLTAAGVVVGLLASAALTQPLARLLLGVRPLDPTTFASVTALMALVALLACAIPARRATRVDPVQALRSE